MIRGDISAAAVAGMTRNARAIFFKALESSAYRAKLAKLAMMLSSTTKIEDHGWLGSVPQMKEWVGERSMERMKEHGFSITNKKWANGIAIPADWVEDDALGQLMPMVQTLADEAEKHKLRLIRDLMTNGFATTKYGPAYDGKAFFATTHAFGSNKLTTALATASYAAARLLLFSMKGDDDESLGLEDSTLTLVHGPNLEATAIALLDKQYDAAGAENPWYKTAERMMISGLNTTTEWFLGVLDKPLKPFASQERRPVRFRARDKVDDSNVFDHDEFQYGADYRGNAGYALPQLMVGSTGAS